jgi:very-short-patch-repair endonuclease
MERYTLSVLFFKRGREMLILPQNAYIKWHPRNKKHFVELGYIYTKIDDEFLVNVEHLLHGSACKVLVKCDYCGKEYFKNYNDYIRQTEECKCKSVACNDCIMKKTSITIKEEYDVDNISSLDFIREKVVKTFIKNYGVSNPNKTSEVRNKIIKTNQERYGVDNVGSSDKIKEKIAQSFYANGTVKTSKQQINIYNLLQNNGYNVELNYPMKYYNLDIALFIDDIKIDIEYDGYFWHKNKLSFDTRKDKYLLSHGWKVIRIKGNRNNPSIEVINESIIKIKNKCSNYESIILDIDDIQYLNDYYQNISNFKEEII